MNPLRLMIVDDEFIIRKGISTSIDWASIGIEIVGEARNGQEALDIAQEIRPDIVMTDIRMPIMDGLTLTARLKEMSPDMKVIIVSGYDDFDYARQALKLGVQEYLMKPVGAEELTRLMIKLVEEVQEERDRSCRELKQDMLLRENIPNIKGQWLTKVFKGELSKEETIRNRAEPLSIALDGPEYVVVSIEIDDFMLMIEDMSTIENELLFYAVHNIVNEILQQGFSVTTCRWQEDTLCVLVNLKAGEMQNLLQQCRKIQDSIRQFIKLSVTIGIGSVVDAVDLVSVSRKQSHMAMLGKVYQGNGQLLCYDPQIHTNLPDLPLSPTKDEQVLVEGLAALEEHKLNELIEQWFQTCERNKWSIEQLQAACVKLIILLIHQAEKIGIDDVESMGRSFRPYEEIKKYKTALDIKLWLIKIVNKLRNGMTTYQSSRYKYTVYEAVAYMNEHYKEELKLEDIAGHVYVTPNYLSRVFKLETGEHLTEWLNKLRVKKAKGALKDLSLKVYEIAELVGYKDYKYFALNFKKYAGVTPKQFRESL